MKILILTPQLPYPSHQGTSLRNFHIIRGLAQRHDITLLSFLEPEQTADPATIDPLLKRCTQVETMPTPRRIMLTRLRQLITSRLPDMAHRLFSHAFDIKLRHLLVTSRFDVVQVEGIELARYINVIRHVSPDSKIVFDNHNAETELQRRNFETDLSNPRRWPAAAYSWVQIGRLQRFERWAIETADAAVAVSETDRQHLQSLLGNSQLSMANGQLSIEVIPNCIDVEAYQSEVLNGSVPQFDLVFSGKMDYRPNVDAVLWFADAVWPGIVAQRPFTTWAVVGQKPHPRLDQLREVDGITVTGWVERVEPYLQGAGVFIMPFRVGSGTRLKLIEAMAAGKAIVSTPVGAEGFPVKHRQELWLAEDEREMETAVLHLLNHPEERATLGRAAQQFVQRYDWRVIVPRFDEIYREIREDNHA